MDFGFDIFTDLHLSTTSYTISIMEYDTPPSPPPAPEGSSCNSCSSGGGCRRKIIWIIGLLIIIAGAVYFFGKDFGMQEVKEMPSEENVNPTVSQLDADVPDYVADSDAKITERAETDTHMRIDMETINGFLSPVTYYRDKLPEYGWKITRESVNEEKMTAYFRATNSGRKMEVKINGLPEGAGAKIEVTVQK